jgi:hypothetical protein
MVGVPMRVAVVAVFAASVISCRERPGRFEVEPEQDDRPGPRIVTVPYTVARLPPRPPSPVDYAVVRRDVEALDRWARPRKGACPRSIIDRSEERRLYPLIDVMQGLKYVTVTDGQLYGNYVKLMELTPLGRQALGARLVEEAERYVVTIAEREFVAGSESWSWAPERRDRLAVEFSWRWKPLNEVGARLTMTAPHSVRDEHFGRAWYRRDGAGWRLDDVSISDDARDYMWRVTY